MRGTICVVEDDLIIRLWLVRVLEEADFPVVDFDSADRALIHLGRHAAGVIMILTGSHLPGIFDGPDLAQIASISWPSVTVVVTKDADSAIAEVPAGTIIMSKPFEDANVLASAQLAQQREELRRNMDRQFTGKLRQDVPSSRPT
jgi:FixJ family two-component response regulator